VSDCILNENMIISLPLPNSPLTKLVK